MNWNEIELPDKNIYFQDDDSVIYCADCREILPSIKGISAVITDSPYELGFMGKSWDKKGVSFQLDTWRLIREACLPGAMLLSFGGTRTSHRIACAIEDAGWQIRDTIMWVYGSGFPKSLDISKAIDKQKGAKGEITSKYRRPDGTRERTDKSSGTSIYGVGGDQYLTSPVTPEAKLWEGYGTALKPAYESITLAMKPLDGTFANNALKHKVAGLNIDECRINNLTDKELNWTPQRQHTKDQGIYGNGKGFFPKEEQPMFKSKGRFPANFIHDGSQEVMELFPDSKAGGDIHNRPIRFMKGTRDWGKRTFEGFGDSGSAARFFYCAKASRAERDAGLENMPLVKWWGKGTVKFSEKQMDYRQGREYTNHPTRNSHPTVKPLSLMTYLCKLVKMPEYNLILDPFCGSGSTLLACKKLGIPNIGIDSNEKYCEIAVDRLRQSVLRLNV